MAREHTARTLEDEAAAFREIAHRTEVYKSASADREVSEQVGCAVTLPVPVLPEGVDAVVICLLLRNRPALPDNRSGRCADCRGRIQFRPDVPRLRTRLCAFCALRRLRGDA
jgi:hypothetical protein